VDCTPSSNAILACNGIHSTRHQDGGGRSASRGPIAGSRYKPLATARMSLQPLVWQSAFIGRPVLRAVGAPCEQRRHASSRMPFEGRGGRPLSEERPQPMQRSLPVPGHCRGRSKTLVSIEAQGEQTARWLQALEATTALLRPPIAERSFRRRLRIVRSLQYFCGLARKGLVALPVAQIVVLEQAAHREHVYGGAFPMCSSAMHLLYLLLPLDGLRRCSHWFA
jgi:hypothetical protein